MARFVADCFRGSLGFTEGYIKDYWHTEDLMDLMNFLAKNYEAFQELIEGKSPLKLMTKLKHRRRKIRKKAARKTLKLTMILVILFTNYGLIRA